MLTSWHLHDKNERGLYQSEVTSSLAAIQRPGHWAENCKMVYWDDVYISLVSVWEADKMQEDELFCGKF